MSNANGPTYFGEAEFGFGKIQSELNALKPGANVLEVGAGAGILMAMNASIHKDLNFTGVEPMGDGFDYDNVFHRLINTIPNAEIQPVGYEDLKTSIKYDLIYLVNVFEHLPDWKDFLQFVSGTLTENGRCIILCPNYSFPYEPHFQIPIIFNKPLTHFLLKKRITKFETENDCKGLWTSLNFCKFRSVSKNAAQAGFNVSNDKSTFTEMIDRLETDEEFAKRQGLLRLPISVLNKLGLISLFVKSRMFNMVSPYMHLVLTNSGDSGTA
ncbi:MAG: methyltransferase domain-containing protein [Acidimicrobiales bacterium]|nr:MAG: methyltransferase domain-containing protein [Acidimicrobiales bacterium]